MVPMKSAISGLEGQFHGFPPGAPGPVHHRDGIRDGQSLLLVVGHIDGGDLELTLHGPDQRADLDAQLRVQVRQRLVHQEQPRLDHQRPGQDHPLLLPAGKLTGHPVQEAFKLHQLARLRHLGGNPIG
jgi:hypothetical protein